MNRTRLLLLGVLLVAFGLRVYRLDFQSIWTDEGFVAGLAGLSLPDLVAIWNISPQEGYAGLSRLGQDLTGLAVETDIHPPLYYFLIHFWMQLAGSSEYSLRFLAVFFGLLTIPVLYVLGKRLAGREAALLACVFGALSPFYLDFSQQVRMYTLVTFLAVLSMYSFERAFRDGKRLYWVVYILSTSLALYTHYFAITVVLVQGVLAIAALVARRDRLQFSLWMGSTIGAAVLLAPWAPFALRQVFDYQNRSLLTPDWLTVFSRTWQTFNLGVTVDINQAAPALLALLAVVLAGLAIGWWRKTPARSGLAALLIYLVLPLLVGLAIFRFKPMFHPKYFMMASPAYYLLVGASVYSLRRNLRWASLPLGLFLAAMLVYGVNSYFFDSRYWKDDTRALGRYLDGRVTEQDLVLSDLIEPIDYYYDGQAPAYYLPGDENTAPGRLASLTRDRPRVFLVHYEHAYTDPQGLVPFLLERSSDWVTEKGFRGYGLNEYVLRPGATFDLGSGSPVQSPSFQGKLALDAALVGGEDSGARSGPPAVASGGRLWAALSWKLQTKADGDYKASLTLLDARGHVAAQKDSPITRGIDPTSRWLPGEGARNYYVLPVFPGVAPGEYSLRLSVYASEPAGGGASGEPVRRLGDDLDLGKIVVNSPRLPVEFTSQDMGTRSGAPLGPIEGLGYTIGERSYRPGDTLPLTLFLRSVAPVQQDVRFLFQLRDIQRSSIWQLESAPLYPTSKWKTGDGVRDWQDLPLPGRLAAGDYSLIMTLTPAPAGVPASSWDLGKIQILDRPRSFTVPQVSNPVDAGFGGGIALVGYDLEGDQRPGGTVSLTLYWKALAPVDESYAVFAHLLDAQNRIWAQHDGTPGGDVPTSGWLPGEVVVDRHSLTIRGDASPGEYTLEVGMYEPRSGRRLAVSSAGVKIVDQALWLQRIVLK